MDGLLGLMRLDAETAVVVLAGFITSGLLGIGLGLLGQGWGHFRQAPMRRVMDASRETPADELITVRASRLRSQRRVEQSRRIADAVTEEITGGVRPYTVLMRARN